MSALLPEADLCGAPTHFRFGPIADILPRIYSVRPTMWSLGQQADCGFLPKTSQTNCIMEIAVKILLYYAPIACSLAPYITLTEAGADFEVRSINLRKGQQKSPEYLKINPKHKVPLLVVDGKPLSENVAIQQWIDMTFPSANLFPKDPWQRLQAVSLLSWCSSGIHPYLTRMNSPIAVCDVAGTEESVFKIAKSHLFENYKLADEMLAGREFFFDHFTAPDSHFFWCFRRGTLFDIDLSQFKNCTAHFERMKTRASVQKLLAFEKSVQAEFAKVA